MSENDPKEDKIRVNCIQNCDCTRIKYPPKWKDETRVQTTLVAWDKNHTGAWELVEDRVAIDSYRELPNKARYMCVCLCKKAEKLKMDSHTMQATSFQNSVQTLQV